jgi:ABC transport system ATP-binding/permease protein
MQDQLPDKPPHFQWRVGKAPGCDIVVNQPGVSNEHCLLSLYSWDAVEGSERVWREQFVIEDLNSTNGTLVDSQPLEPGVRYFVELRNQVTLGTQTRLPWPSIIRIGREPDNDICLDYPMISRHHAQITRRRNEWIIADVGSANGTALNQVSTRITEAAPLLPTDEIYLGSYKIAASKVLAGRKLTLGAGQYEKVVFKGTQMVLGRDPESQYHLDYPMVSWRHALLERTPDGITVEDLNSRNGTYVNGTRISGKTLVRPGQEIGLGSFRFTLLEDGALAKREYKGDITIEVASMVVCTARGHRLLDPVSLTIFPSELVALMGPAGAGKTTFLKAIIGYTPPTQGRVLINGYDLYQFYDRFRQQISYVPQDDIVHPQLTVREALYFSARLRTDLSDGEIEKRIDTVLSSLGIPGKKDSIIGSPERKVLSGGERKRVNIAMELIAAAPVIFLDEPTSGLSSYDAENVMQVLKKLSADGTTVVTTIHQPSLSIFRQFDDLIMIAKDQNSGKCGALAYFGPAFPESIEFFDPVEAKRAQSQPGKQLGPEMLLTGLARRPTADWVSTYENSQYRKLYVVERSGKIPSPPRTTASSSRADIGLGQWWTLVRRNWILKVRDRAQSLILLLQAPFFAALVAVVFRSLRYSNLVDFQRSAQHATGIEFLLVVAAVWFGCNNVARDIVGEQTVFQRERMVNLKLPSYLFSKLTIAAVLNFVQCLLLLGIVTLACDLRGNFAVAFGVLYLSSLVGSSIGLCVSAMASTTEAAIATLPLILLPVIALGGGLSPIPEMKGPVPWAATMVPSRWAFEAMFLNEARAKTHGSSFQSQVVNGKTIGDPETTDCDLAYHQFPDQADVCLDVRWVPPGSSTAPVPDQASYVRHAIQTCFVVLGVMLVFWTVLGLLTLKLKPTR